MPRRLLVYCPAQRRLTKSPPRTHGAVHRLVGRLGRTIVGCKELATLGAVAVTVLDRSSAHWAGAISRRRWSHVDLVPSGNVFNGSVDRGVLVTTWPVWSWLRRSSHGQGRQRLPGHGCIRRSRWFSLVGCSDGVGWVKTPLRLHRSRDKAIPPPTPSSSGPRLDSALRANVSRMVVLGGIAPEPNVVLHITISFVPFRVHLGQMAIRLQSCNPVVGHGHGRRGWHVPANLGLSSRWRHAGRGC